MLEEYIRNIRKEKDILLMTHIVLGYPSFEESFKIVENMVAAGVDLMELQIPFSEPIADGPVILRANQMALAGGTKVQQCLEFSQRLTQTFDIPFLIMSYYNILFQYGVERFAASMREADLRGAIVPDLPPEEGEAYLTAMEQHQLSPILIFSPTTPFERMSYLSTFASGFVYCMARKGVTGAETRFSGNLEQYLANCRKATTLPLALGFGVKEKRDVDFLKGKVDVAIVGSETIRVVDQQGVHAIGKFIESLRQ